MLLFGLFFHPFCLTAAETKAVVLFICSCSLCNNSSHKKTNQKSMFCSAWVSQTRGTGTGSSPFYWCCREASEHAVSCRLSTPDVQKWTCQTISHSLWLLLPTANSLCFYTILRPVSEKYNWSNSQGSANSEQNPSVTQVNDRLSPPLSLPLLSHTYCTSGCSM